MKLFAAIVAWSLANRPVVLLATLLLALLGVRAALKLPIDAVPDVTNIQVQVITSAPALSPAEVEQYVTVPVERAMAGIPKTTEVRSTSKYGLSVVTVVFQDGTDIYFARQQVGERMAEATEAVPEQYGRPELGPISSGLGEIFQFVVRNERLTLMELEEVLDWQIGPVLRTVPGIVEVNSFGGQDRQYQVMLDPKRLQAAGVSVSQVIGATTEGIPITVATVGDVQFGPRLRRGAASKDGKGEVVVGVALMLLGENSRTVTEAVKAKLHALQPSLPEGTRVEPFYDRSTLVDRTIGTVATNLLEGALLVVLVLLLLLGDWRAGFVVAITIPLSLLIALIAMQALGRSGNLMSLGAIDFGLIVDGAVIIVENAVRRLSEQRRAFGRELAVGEKTGVIERSTLEVLSASVFGVLIIAIVYVPLLALTGVEGKLFQPMATTVLFALGGAFLLSLTLVPVLTSYLVRPRAEAHETWLLRAAGRVYAPLLAAVMRFRAATVGASVLTLAGAAALFTQLGAEFVPQLDEGDVLVEARRLPGVALTESIATDQRLQKAILSVPEVSQAVSKTGAPELATDPMGIEATDVYIGLKDREKWRPGITKEDIATQISEALEKQVPEIATGISQPIQMRTNELVAGIRSDVAALVYGPDLQRLNDVAEQIAAALRRVPGAEDVRVEQVAGLRYLKIEPDRNRLARYGLTVADVNQITETIAVGHDVGDVLEGERRFGIVVKTDHRYDGDLNALLSLPLRSVSGQVVPLGDVARLSFVTGPAQISRDSQSRRIMVELNVKGRDLLSVVHEAQAAVRDKVKVPTGYRIEWGGQFHHYEEAKARLSVVVPLALALIGFFLWMAFRSARAALIIFLNVPFAIVGGVVALWLRDIPFSISAGVGFIALFGVAVLNGLVLIGFAEQLERAGKNATEAIREAAELRLRPVLMTALVASLGFLPMALSTAPGSEVQRPLATVVIGGLITATLLTLLVMPVVYSLLNRKAAAPSVAR